MKRQSFTRQSSSLSLTSSLQHERSGSSIIFIELLAYSSRMLYYRVEDIFAGKSEADKVLHKDSSPTLGYLLLPDMKWDLTTVSTLYLLAIAVSRDIKSLRDLRKEHLPMLRSIRREACRVVHEKWGLEAGSLRFYVHYQPSYCQSPFLAFA